MSNEKKTFIYRCKVNSKYNLDYRSDYDFKLKDSSINDYRHELVSSLTKDSFFYYIALYSVFSTFTGFCINCFLILIKFFFVDYVAEISLLESKYLEILLISLGVFSVIAVDIILRRKFKKKHYCFG